MRLVDFTMRAYGACTDVSVPLGPGVTVVLGGNESGKSTALDALGDLLWGIPARSSRAYVHARGSLRIDATIEDDGATSVVVRRGSGLFATDLVQEVASPWDPEASGSAEWWRVRLGLTLDQLRAGGREVFAGGGDLGEAVFAAREGRSARMLLQSLKERRDALFKGDRRARNVRIREALSAYDDARDRRDSTLTRSGSVSSMRERVEHLTRELEIARRFEADMDRRVRIAEEDSRAIAHVRTIVAAQSVLAQIEAEGPRLTDEQLTRLRDAVELAAEARGSMVRLTQRIEDVDSRLGELVVDDALLLDVRVVQELRMKAGERISEVRRADDEHAPIVREQTARLISLVGRLGLDAGDDLDAVITSIDVPLPVQADVTSVAEVLAEAERRLVEVRAARDDTVATLVGHGMVLDPSAAPRPDLFETLRTAIVTARATVATSADALARARTRLEGLRASGAVPAPVVNVERSDVLAARAGRDEAWHRLRAAWTSGELPADAERHDWAAALDQAVQTSDDVADRWAADRAVSSAHDARQEAQQEGVADAAADMDVAEGECDAAARQLAEAEQSWRAAWLDLGAPDAPSTDAAPELMGLIVKAAEQQVLVASAERSVEQARRAWRDACARVSLEEDTRPAGWQARTEVLAEVSKCREARDAAATKEAGLRASWESYRTEVEEVLVRHGVLDDALGGESALSPAGVERGLELLGRLCEAATNDDATRRSLADKRHDLLRDLREVERVVGDEQVLRHELAAEHGIDEGPGLDERVERAERAMAPMTTIVNARHLLEGALDAGSTSDEVIRRLTEADRESVAGTLQEAMEAQQAARTAALDTAGALSEAASRLRDLESAGSAADAEAAVADRLGDLVALAEEWSVLSLQVVLLEQTLERMGTDDTRPLLDRAGRILERITAGRYLALRADETPTGRTLQVVRADGDRVSPTELSEGTGDQVFFALRMAAVTELHEQRRAASLPALPLVLDDVLMAFDDARALDALTVLHELAPGLQIIVFTHHASVAEAARAIEGITVSRLPAPPMIDAPLDGETVRATVQHEAAPAQTPAPVQAAVARDAKDERAAARAWAQAQGIPVAARGRVPEEILEQYRASRR